MRSPDDAGVVLFFDLLNQQGTAPRGKEAAAVQTYYRRPVATHADGLAEWPIPA